MSGRTPTPTTHTPAHTAPRTEAKPAAKETKPEPVPTTAAAPVNNPPYVPPHGPADLPPPVPPEAKPDPEVKAYLDAFKAPKDPRDPAKSEIPPSQVNPSSNLGEMVAKSTPAQTPAQPARTA